MPNFLDSVFIFSTRLRHFGWKLLNLSVDYAMFVISNKVCCERGYKLTTEQVIKFELTSNCICEVYDEDTDTSSPSDYCYGCWTEEKENFKFCVIEPWLAANGWDSETLVLVQSLAMNWNKVAGWTSARAGEIVDTLTLNGDFTLRFELNGKDLTCVRSSHDEYGALFTITELPNTEE